MIYIISLVMLVVCMVGGAVLLAAGPNVKSIVDKDFSRKAYTVAKLASLQYGDVAIRAKTVIPDVKDQKPTPNSRKKLDFEWTVRKNGVNVTVEDSALHIYEDDSGQEMIDSNITQKNKAPDLF
ncbi:MAG: hypothetical protein PHT59_06255 [Candidatus Omnitrophica bacterium]|nr:hypothetical protein [Candidatus Omnitrophota bacterium]